MYRICLKLIVLSISVLVLSAGCAKDELAVLSSAKIPVTTASSMALNEFQQGMSFSNKQQRVKAVEHFHLALAQDPEFAMAWLQLAFVSPGTDLFMAALDSARKHAAHTSEGEQLIIKAAYKGFTANSIEQEVILKKLVSQFPGDEQAHLLLGNYYFGLQQYHKAIESYTSAAKVNNDLAILHNQLGYSQRALGNYGEAEKAFKFYIKLNSDNPNAYDSYAELLMEMGRFKESIEFYAMALERDSYFVASYVGIACNYGFLGEPAKALEQLELLKSIAQNDNDTRRAIFTEALTHVCSGKIEKALESMESSLEIDELRQDVGNIANDLLILGNLYLELDSPAEALARFNQSMRIINASNLPEAVKDNAYTTHLYNISRVFSAKGEFGKAEETAELFERKVNMSGNPLRIQLSSQLKGILALEQNQFQKAIDQLEQANQLNPYNLYRIGKAYQGLERHENAATYLLRAEELNVLNSMDQAIVLSKTKFAKDPA